MPAEPPAKPPLPKPPTMAERDKAATEYHAKAVQEMDRTHRAARQSLRMALRRWLGN